MICEYCDSDVSDECEFCPNCGAKTNFIPKSRFKTFSKPEEGEKTIPLTEILEVKTVGPNTYDAGSFGLGFVLGFFFGIVILVLTLVLGKNNTRKGVLFGFFFKAFIIVIFMIISVLIFMKIE